MYRPQRENFVIQVRGGGGGEGQYLAAASNSRVAPSKNNSNNKFNNNNFSSMKLFDRFRKIVMRFIFSIPSSRNSSSSSSNHRQNKHGDRPDPPKTSCSSSLYHYSPNSHYTEAIADCIEFFNRSSQEGSGCSDYGARKSDALV